MDRPAAFRRNRCALGRRPGGRRIGGDTSGVTRRAPNLAARRRASFAVVAVQRYLRAGVRGSPDKVI